MNQHLNLSIVIPIYGFQPQREAAFSNLLSTLEAQDLKIISNTGVTTDAKAFEVIIVEQTSKDGVHTIPQKPYIKHVVLPAQESGFNKSWCMNVAAKMAVTDNLVFIDVDMVFDKTYFTRIRSFKNPQIKYFTCWQYIVHMPGKDNPIPRLVTKDVLTAGGAFCVEKQFFWDVGGMNENYFGYGGEDNDLWIRVNKALGERSNHNVPSMPYALAHWYHDWAEPSPDRFYPLNRTLQCTADVMRKLCQTSLGNPLHPTPIDLSDLKLKEPGIEEGAKARGIL